MAEYDVIVKGGMIVDGLRTPRYKSDIAIKDGKIAKIGGLGSGSATKVLDASGLIVAPGLLTFTPTTMRRSSGTPIAPCLAGMA